MECDGSDISGADERDLAVSTRRIDLALVSDRCKMLLLGKVFYPLPVSSRLYHMCRVWS